MEAYFGFKKTPFGDHPDGKQLFPSQTYTEAKARLQFLAEHHGTGLLTGEVGSGKSTAARTFTAGLNSSLYKILYLHWTSGSALDLLRQLALELNLEPAHYRGDLVRQISAAIVNLNQSKKQHPILICDEHNCCVMPPSNSFLCWSTSTWIRIWHSAESLRLRRGCLEWGCITAPAFLPAVA
jgi:general secretion pathway protein A